MTELNYEYKPLSKRKLDALKQSAPKIYEEMVAAFGEDNVVNNIVADFVVLTEGKNVTGMDGVPFSVTREMITNAAKVNNRHFMEFIKHPVNSIKTWVKEIAGDEEDEMSGVGFAPIMLNHKKNDVTGRQGYVLGNSYKVVNINGVYVLMCKGILINPEAKWRYIQGQYREVSPTIDLPRTGFAPKVPYKIRELSFVNIPAQSTNTSLSSGDEVVNFENINSQVEDQQWEEKIKQAYKAADLEKTTNLVKRKEHLANAYAESLVRGKVVPSSMREQIKNTFVQLSDGEVAMVAGLIKDATRKSIFVNKPRTFLLKGTIDMNLSKDDRYLAFVEKNKNNYPSEIDLRTAFEKAEAQTATQLSDGEGTLQDSAQLMSEMMEKLEVLHKQGAITDEHRKMLSKYCGKDEVTSLEGGTDPDDLTSMGGESSAGDGKTSEAGGVVTPNNTSLSAPENKDANADLIQVLQAGFNAEKADKEKALDELNSLKAQLLTVKNALN